MPGKIAASTRIGTAKTARAWRQPKTKRLSQVGRDDVAGETAIVGRPSSAAFVRIWLLLFAGETPGEAGEDACPTTIPAVLGGTAVAGEPSQRSPDGMVLPRGNIERSSSFESSSIEVCSRSALRVPTK